MKKIAVILSGCGVFDGSEIHESVLTLLALSQAKVAYQCMAPNIEQRQVVNHLTQRVIVGETRNVLVESARIARGDIIDLADAVPEEYAAAILPGGFGAAKNLSDFADKGADSDIQPALLAFCQALIKAKKPIGFMCIAPAMIPKLYQDEVTLTIGTDVDTANTLKAMGAKHVNCVVGNIVIDSEHKVITTPAYMLAESVADAAEGISQLVNEVIRQCNLDQAP